MDFAHIEDNKVVNVVVAETLEDAELATEGLCIPYDKKTEFVGIGMEYDSETKKVIIPPQKEISDTV
jgi:hypothetical protein